VSLGVTLIVKRLRLSLLVCVFANTTLAAAFAQSIAIEVADAAATHDRETGERETGEPVVAVRMSPASAHAFFDLTVHNIRRAAAVIVDGHVISKPAIITPIAGGIVQIAGDLSVEEARSMARRLSDGTSKLTIEIPSDGDPGK